MSTKGSKWKAWILEATPIEDDEQPVHPVWPALLGFFLPGTGQLMVGSIVKACLIFLVWCTFWILHASPWWVALHVIGAADAAWVALVRRRMWSQQQQNT